MAYYDRHNRDKRTRYSFDQGRFNEFRDNALRILRHRTTHIVLGGSLMLGFLGKEEISDTVKDFTGFGTETSMQQFTAEDAARAVLLADYGEAYERGKYPQLDIVVDTAKSSTGFKQGIKHLFGKPLSRDTIYTKRILSDENLFASLNEQALDDLRADVETEAKKKAGETTLGGSNLLAPVSKPHITSRAGPRKSPCAGCSSNHGGVDYRGKAGTDVLAVNDAKVVQSHINRQSIGTVILEGVDAKGKSTGYRYVYMHVRPHAKVGTVLKAGEKVTTIAKRGEYGPEPSQADHLHFEIYKKGRFGGWTKMDPKTLNKLATATLSAPKPKKNGLFNRLGEYVFNAVKKSDDKNIVAVLYGENERLRKENKISKAEYNTRQKGIDALGKELYKRGLKLYVKNEHENVEKLAEYTVNLLDKNNAVNPAGVVHKDAAQKEAVEMADNGSVFGTWPTWQASVATLQRPAFQANPAAPLYAYRDNSVLLMNPAPPLRDKVAEFQSAKNNLLSGLFGMQADALRNGKQERRQMTEIYQRMMLAFGG